MAHLERSVLSPGEFETLVDEVAARVLDPYTAVDELLRRASAAPQRPDDGPEDRS